MRSLTNEEIRGLAALERDMDAGKQPFVVYEGMRWAFPQEVLDACSCVSGQTVSFVLCLALQEENLAQLGARIALEKAKKS